MAEFILVSLLATSVCCIPAVILGSIFHYSLIANKGVFFTISLITLFAISLGSIISHLMILFVIDELYTLLTVFAVLTSGLCGLLAATLRVIWLKLNKADITKKVEWLKTILFFDLIAVIIIVFMFMVLMIVIETINYGVF